MFSPVSFQSEQLAPLAPENDTEQEGRTVGESVERKSLGAVLQGLVNESLRRIFYPNDVCFFSLHSAKGVV